MIRISQNQSIHNAIIKEMVSTYQSKGYINIKAAHISFLNGQPMEVNGHIPDVTAQYNGKLIICEVETNDSLTEANTISQLKAFARSAYEFHIAVPATGIKQAQNVAQQNGITVDQYWYSQNY